jgi:hypothetical protein
MNIEIRKLTDQEREHYTHCPCCGTRLKAQTLEETVAIVMLGFAKAREREKAERRLRKAQEK